MSVEVYQPVLKAPLKPIRTAYQAVQTKPAVTSTPISREVRPVYYPIKPNMELILEIETMTHPSRPSFAELEAIILAEGL